VSRLGKLGDPPRVKVTKVVRTSWRIEWEYDGHAWSGDPGDFADYDRVRRLRVRHMQSKTNAFRAAAMRLIFCRRDRYSKGFGEGGKSTGCTLCETSPVSVDSESGPGGCRYHDETSVERLRARLARRLYWQAVRSGATR